jgi:Ser-tRNA(Ala) deacylase AlaX
MIEPSTFVPEDFKEESPTIPPTEMIYYDYEGNFQMKCNAKIVSVHFYDDNKIQLCLDKTVMHAQGGGQPADRGSISLLEDDAQVDVTKVTMDRSTNIATHIGTVKDSFASKIIVGIPVCVKVDEGNRRVLAECVRAMTKLEFEQMKFFFSSCSHFDFSLLF